MQKYRDRNGRCVVILFVAILFRSIGVRGRCDSRDGNLSMYQSNGQSQHGVCLCAGAPARGHEPKLWALFGRERIALPDAIMPAPRTFADSGLQFALQKQQEYVRALPPSPTEALLKHVQRVPQCPLPNAAERHILRWAKSPVANR